ncbi:MAG: Thymidylate kinase [Firmicutes bacterium ADurb.Bin182]|nr:MAG: Thymidylate kinase [Firmicutes bacterium ADurb.Bin182]
MKKTRVIAIEGIDGSGKSVQLELLKSCLLAKNLKVAVRSFPEYSSFFGSRIGELLSGADGLSADEVDGKSMALWFALDRWENFANYKDGDADVLLINRYVLSNAVYQSIRDRDLDKPDLLEWVFELEFRHFKIPEPDIHLIFDVDPAAAARNVDKKGFRDYVGRGRDVYESMDSIQSRARAKYLEYAKRLGNAPVIKCMENGSLLPMETIAALVQKEISRFGL